MNREIPKQANNTGILPTQDTTCNVAQTQGDTEMIKAVLKMKQTNGTTYDEDFAATQGDFDTIMQDVESNKRMSQDKTGHDNKIKKKRAPIPTSNCTRLVRSR